LSTRIDPIWIQYPAINIRVGVFPTEPVRGFRDTFFDHAISGGAVHDEEVGICRVTDNGAIGFDRHRLSVFKQVDADVGDGEVRKAANGLHGALEH